MPDLKVLSNLFTNSVINIMVWVVFSLLLFEIINLWTEDKFYKKIEDSKYSQPFWAALMGSIPGCGGPILLTNLYVKKTISLGSITASFIATFGDAAFVILANDPVAFLWLLLISLVVALIVGYLIDFTFIGEKLTNQIDKKRLKHTKKQDEREQKDFEKYEYKYLQKSKPPERFVFFEENILIPLFFILFLVILPATILNLVMGFSGTTFENLNSGWKYYVIISDVMAFLIIVFFIPYFFIRKYFMKGYDERNAFSMKINVDNLGKDAGTTETTYNIDKQSDFNFKKLQKYVFLNSIFIMTWVFFGLLIFSLMFFPFIDFWNGIFGYAGGFVGLLIAICVGMIPGCGPQIAFASLYLGVGQNYGPGQGPVTDAAITANSINQDGDAGFPLLALDRSSFFVIRVLNTIPAFIVGAIMLGFGLSFH